MSSEEALFASLTRPDTINPEILLWLLLPLTAVSSWLAARFEYRRNAAKQLTCRRPYLQGLNFLLNEQFLGPGHRGFHAGDSSSARIPSKPIWRLGNLFSPPRSGRTRHPCPPGPDCPTDARQGTALAARTRPGLFQGRPVRPRREPVSGRRKSAPTASRR